MEEEECACGHSAGGKWGCNLMEAEATYSVAITGVDALIREIQSRSRKGTHRNLDKLSIGREKVIGPQIGVRQSSLASPDREDDVPYKQLMPGQESLRLSMS